MRNAFLKLILSFKNAINQSFSPKTVLSEAQAFALGEGSRSSEVLTISRTHVEKYSSSEMGSFAFTLPHAHRSGWRP